MKDSILWLAFSEKIDTSLCYGKITKSNRGVAQVARVRAWGARGRKFKSCHSDQTTKPQNFASVAFLLGFNWIVLELL